MRPVTHPGYGLYVPRREAHLRRSRRSCAPSGGGYADLPEVGMHARAHVRAGAGVRTDKMHLPAFYVTYVTLQEVSKKEQVRAIKPGYTLGYACCNRRNPSQCSNPKTPRAEVTHA